LEKSYERLGQSEKGGVDYEMYRNSLVKSFELTLEQSGKLLRKKICSDLLNPFEHLIFKPY